ncbi:NADH-dependent flavin oxidoreductase [Oceanobacillus oncorhynchi subsp. oncorhynchi]|uniref:NADH-dependent flavin oxidoreductase n=1 Tax=Oceanobacillus TaxID=182709 RepID=UPI0030D8D583
MDKKFEPLFEKVTLPNKIELRNKFVLAPLTHASSNDDGTISDAEINYIKKRSKDVGLAISAASNVADIGKAFPGQPSVAHDSNLDGLKRLAEAMKQNGARAIVQIHHGGAQSMPYLTPNGDVVAPSPITLQGDETHSPSYEKEEHHAREMTQEEIEHTIKAFGEATRRVIEAGFNGVEIHGANHYLIQQFVSPYYNRRDDAWGENRLKFPMKVVDEVINTVKAHADENFIVGYRFSPEEAETPGITMEITEELVKNLIEKPLDFLHVSLMNVHSKTREGKYQGEERIKLLHQWVDGRMPLIGIGSIFTAEDALEAIESGNVDLIALGREILLDHHFINKIQNGKAANILSEFNPDREDKHDLPPKLWEQINKGLYPLPRTDSK